MDNKKILAIDTSDHICSVAISIGDNIVSSKSIGNKLSHCENLMPQVKQSFDEVDFSINEIDYIFVIDGPGSFTGIRIGVATAKALAHFKNIPIIPIKSLTNIASMAKLNDDCIIVPLIDARRRTFYTEFFEKSYKNSISDIMHIEIDEIINKLLGYDKKVYFIGDNITKLFQNYNVNLNDNFNIIDITDDFDRAISMVKMAEYSLKDEKMIKTYNTVEPFYLKKSQAEREYDEKQGVK